MERCENCSYIKNRDPEEMKRIIRRLNIAEGQIRGIKQMIEDNRNCEEILMQMSAVSKSLKTLGSSMLKSQLETCLVKDIRKSDFNSIDDVISLFERVS